MSKEEIYRFLLVLPTLDEALTVGQGAKRTQDLRPAQRHVVNFQHGYSCILSVHRACNKPNFLFYSTNLLHHFVEPSLEWSPTELG